MQLRETRDILQQTNAEVVAGVRAALRRARQVCCYGSGREGLALKAFATRLHQMDISVGAPLPHPLPPKAPAPALPDQHTPPACSCCLFLHVMGCLQWLTVLFVGFHIVAGITVLACCDKSQQARHAWHGSSVGSNIEGELARRPMMQHSLSRVYW